MLLLDGKEYVKSVLLLEAEIVVFFSTAAKNQLKSKRNNFFEYFEVVEILSKIN